MILHHLVGNVLLLTTFFLLVAAVLTLQTHDQASEDAANRVWGNFNQHNDIIVKLESHMGSVGSQFIIEGLADFTIDDDKLRHVSTGPLKGESCRVRFHNYKRMP